MTFDRVSFDRYLEPPDDLECCEADDCLEKDEDGNAECRCESHVCSTCEGQCSCRCDADYDAYRESRLDDR